MRVGHRNRELGKGVTPIPTPRPHSLFLLLFPIPILNPLLCTVSQSVASLSIRWHERIRPTSTLPLDSGCSPVTDPCQSDPGTDVGTNIRPKIGSTIGPKIPQTVLALGGSGVALVPGISSSLWSGSAAEPLQSCSGERALDETMQITVPSRYHPCHSAVQ